MQRLSWDVIRARAVRFAADWAGPRDEKRDTQTFYNEFFAIFGVDRKRLATYEMRVELLAKKFGFIDLFWPGVLLVEQKTSFLDLDKAGSQALTYIDALPDNAAPTYLLTCDFHHWRLRDLERNTDLRFTLDQLPENIGAFAFMLGRRQDFGSQPAVNIAAAELMGKLHVALEKSGYTGLDLERLLVRLLSGCLPTTPAFSSLATSFFSTSRSTPRTTAPTSVSGSTRFSTSSTPSRRGGRSCSATS